MNKRVIVGEAEYLEPADYNRFGEFAQAATDNVVGDVIGYPAHWAGFTISQKSAQEVTVSPGRYFEGSIVYAAEEAEDINLTIYLPNSPTDDKWVAILPRGVVRSVDEDRSFETSLDPETSEPVVISTPVVEARGIDYAIQQGVGSPPPALKPTIDEQDACLAFVRLTTSGIQEIVPGDQWRAKTLAEVEGRVTSLEIRTDQLFEDTETIRTDLSNVAADVNALRNAMPDGRVFAQMVRDTAKHSQVLNLPDEARNYWFDQALIRTEPDTEWDFQAGGYFRIDEGIRFQFAAQFDHQLRLQSYDNPALFVWDNRLVMPAFTEVVRISSPTGTGRKDISNSVHTVTTAIRKTRSHQRIRYGETVTVCENSAGWPNLADKKAGEVFKAAGEEWVAQGKTNNPWNDSEIAQNGHSEYAVRRVIKETYRTTYTVYDTEEFGLNGAIFGQTFLCSQVMVATSIDLNFTRIGDTGDVMLCLCEVDGSGAPNYEAVLAMVNKPRGELVLGWNKFTFEPTLLEQGRRYAWFTVTTGNHQIMTNSGNAFNGGTLFLSTDGAWSQGFTTEDFTFRLNAARFASSRVVAEFLSLTLENGMTEVEMVYKAWEPAATKLAWEVRVPAQGADAPWIPMDGRENNPLANLPALVQLRAVLVGTEDVAPMVELDQYARAIAGRMRTDMRAISKLIPFGFGTAEASIVLNMDNYDAAKHTAAPKIVLADNSVVDPDAVVATVDRTKPSRTTFVANFTLPAGTSQARVRVDATTDNVIDVPFGQDVQLNAF